MATEDVQTNLRIPADLKEHLQKAAEASGRSLSAEVAYRVAKGFELGNVLEVTRAELALARETLDRTRLELEMKNQQLHAVMSDLATQRADVRTLKQTRESDIDAATKFLQERIDSLADRAGAAEREVATVTAALKAQLIQSERSVERAARAETEVEALRRMLAEREADAVNLMPTVVRLERDVARAELAAESYRYKLGFVSQALFALTDAMPPKARLPGDPHSMTAGDWRDFSAAMSKESEGVAKRLTKLVDEVRQLEERVQGREPTLEEMKAHLPGWGDFVEVQVAPDPLLTADRKATEVLRRTRKPKPKP